MRPDLWRRLARLEEQRLEAARRELARIRAQREQCLVELACTAERWREALAAPVDPVLLPFAQPWAARLAAQIRVLSDRRRQLDREEEEAIGRVSEQLARRDAPRRLAERAAEAERARAARGAQTVLDDLAAVRSAYRRHASPKPPFPPE